MSKLLIWLAGILIVVAGVWYFFGRQHNDTTVPAYSDATSAQSQSVAEGQSSDTSDAAMQGDVASIDTQLQGASADANSAASFNDAPVAQTE